MKPTLYKIRNTFRTNTVKRGGFCFICGFLFFVFLLFFFLIQILVFPQMHRKLYYRKYNFTDRYLLCN